jgi:hypothetical protein
MEKITIAGLFGQQTSADEILNELLRHGFNRNQISVACEANTYKTNPLKRRRLSAFESLEIREVGPSMVTGPAAEDVSASGDLQKWLQDAGISRKKSHQVVTGMREGGTLIVVQADEEEAKDALKLLRSARESGGTIQDAVQPYSGSHGSGGGIRKSVPDDLIMSSKSRLLRSTEQRGRRGSGPQAPQGGGHTSGGGIKG